MTAPTLFWHDYETSGADKARDRPWQFAALRTTLDLVPIGEPLVLHCRPAADVLPQPQAVAITGLTPQQVEAEGMAEHQFAERILREMSVPNTCSVGFNSIRFDDEFTRHLFYRNFQDPYEREWRNDNSRWDIIDVARLCHALRPDGINWPKRPDGFTSFRLEDLAAANGLQQGTAHNALSDVHTTIALARLIREKQPALYQHTFDHRRKNVVQKLVKPGNLTPFVHVASYYPAADGNLTVLVPLLADPTNANQVWCWDLRRNPAELADMTDEQIGARLYERAAERDEDTLPFGLRTVAVNKSPAVAPTSTLGGVDLGRFNLDLAACKAHLVTLQGISDITERVTRALALHPRPTHPNIDPDLALYEGFPTEHDRRLFGQVRRADPYKISGQEWPFDNPRYTELLFRYRGRNFPQTLNEADTQRWQAYCQQRLVEGTEATSLNAATFAEQLAACRTTPLGAGRGQELDALEAWVAQRVAPSSSPASAPRP